MDAISSVGRAITSAPRDDGTLSPAHGQAAPVSFFTRCYNPRPMPLFPAWHFRAMDRGEINVDPVHDEFFKAQDLADALVREAIQNSLDARRGSSKVQVHFRIATGDDALDANRAATYLRGLEDHLPEASVVDLAGAMPFLVVEDSGTRGLTGNPGEDPELDAGPQAHGIPRNDFYYFWRNVGRSGKGELDRGRWGLGKAVFPVSSRIRTMFGVTTRGDDGRTLLLGQSVLKTHVLDGSRYAPYGFFARVQRDAFPHAIEDADAMEQFIRDFGLQRSEPGLSIVVPFPRLDDIAFDSLLRSAIVQYFYPIIRNDLAVTVEENGRSETVSSRTIEEVAERLGLDQALARLCRLTRTSMQLDEHEWISIAEPSSTGAPKWREDLLPPSQLQRLRERFEAGEVLAFRLAVPVRRKRSRAAGRFSVVLERDEALRRGEHHFIRRGITIPEVRSAKDKPVRALLIADDEALSTFLGDAENPAHSDWSERNDRIRTLYENGASTLRYVKNAIANLAALLATPPAGRAPDLLADLFSIASKPEQSGEGIAANGSAKAHAAGAAEGGAIPAKRSEGGIRITPVAGGFTLHGHPALRNVGTPFVAEVAYRTRNGNPFRKYSRFDFTLDAMNVKADGLSVRLMDGNRLELVPSHPEFHLAVTGFDARRDLVVRVARKDDDVAEAELH